MRTVVLATLLLLGLSIVPGFAVAPALAWDPEILDWCSQLNMYPGPLLQPVFDVACHPTDQVP